MKRTFLINIIFVLLINFLIKPVYIFGIDLTVQNRVETGAYGLYFTLLSFTYLFQVFHDIGLNYFNNRHIAQNNHLISKYFSRLFILKLLLCLIYLLVLMIAGLFSGYTIQYTYFLFLLGTVEVLSTLVLFFRSNISGLALYMTDSFISVLDRLLLIFICGFLLFHPSFNDRFSISWFIHAQVITMGITAVIAFLVLKKHLKPFKWRMPGVFALSLLKQSYPYALAVLLMTMYTRLDSIMIEQLLPDGLIEADYYASAFRLLQACNTIGFLFAGLLLPMFARQLKAGETVENLLRFSFEMLMAGSIILAVGSVLYRNEIMTTLYNTGSSYTGSILAYLMVCFIAVCGIFIYSALLTANGSLKAMNRVFIFTVILNFVLNLLLIPRYKAVGAAFTTLVTHFIVFFALVILTNKLLRLIPSRSMILRITGFSLMLTGSALAIQSILTVDWLLKFGLTLGAGLLLAAVFKLLDIRNFLAIMRLKKS